MRERQNLLRRRMRQAGVDAMLLSGAVNIRYYTGFTSPECIVLLTEETCRLITDFRYTLQAQAQTDGCVLLTEANQADQQLAALKAFLAADGCRRCGYEQDALTVEQFRRYGDMPTAWVPFGTEANGPRLIKSAREIAKLQKAQSMADRAFAKLLPRLRLGMTEREAAAELNYLCALEGSEGPSFDPIVGSGPNGAMCHAIPGERRFQSGDLVVFDFGCIFDGYHSDMTRTIAFGPVDEELKRIYNIVLQAQLLALDAVKAGIAGNELDGVARTYITKAGYGECFGHGLGHGFGLEIHEPPRASTACDTVLLPGMTVTVEPGVYLPGKGGVRIEDCVVVTDSGCINLVSTAKDLLTL